MPGFDDEGGVDTSRIQSYQVREFVEALQGINDDLKAAARASPPSMRLALLGPVSPVALVQAVCQAAESQGRSPVAAGFQLVEIIACLAAARQYERVDRFAETWCALVGEAIARVESHLDVLRRNNPTHLADGFDRYEAAVRAQYATTKGKT